MQSKISKLAVAAIIIIAALIGINQFGGSIDGASVAWADVIETLENDTKSTNTMHILMTLRTVTPRFGEDGEIESEEPHIIKGECWLQRNPAVGKMILEGEHTAYFTESRFTGLDHRSKTWFEQSLTKEKDRKHIYGMFDAFVTGDFKAYHQMSGLSISDGRIAGYEVIDGARATVYEFIGTPSEEKTEEGHPSMHSKCWIRDSDHKTVRMQLNYGDSNKLSMDYELIEYDITIPPNMLDVAIPEGYTRRLTPEERIKKTVPVNIIELKQAYDNARENFGDYRMVILDGRQCIKTRIVKQGKKWRVDTYKDTYKQGIKDAGIFDTSAPLCFSDLWNQIEALQGRIERTVMNYNRGSARGFWPQEGVGGLPKTIYQKHVEFFDITDTLEYLAWRMMYINGKDAKIKTLAHSDKYPGCIGVSISSLSKGYKKMGFPPGALLNIYWIDPSKDYICIKFEHHQRPKPVWEEDNEWEQHEPKVNTHDMNGNFHSEIVEITKLAQTLDGSWYPAEIKIQQHIVNRDGTRVIPSPKAKTKSIYVDAQGSIASELFEWPEELPLPSK